MATPEPSPTLSPATRAVSSLARSRETIIVGGGIAGLACARRLDEAQQPFLLISENLGGRIRRSRDNAVNLGAYYVRADYHHVNQLVTRGRRINARATRRHDPEGCYTLWDRRLLLHLPQAAQFLTKLLAFRRHYEVFKANSVAMSQAQAIRSDPHLWHLYQQPASEFVREHRFDAIARDYMAPGLHGTTFLPLNQLTAFSLLLGALPVIVPIYEFTFQPDALVEGFSDALLEDTVTAITAHNSGYQIETQASGSFTADFVVVATPAEVSQQLLGLPAIKGPVQAQMFEIAGTLRGRYNRADINLFPANDPTLAIARQANGSILFCTQQQTPAFDHYFNSWKVIEHKHWNPAFNLVGETLLECEQAPNLYLIGDHNICGLEDAYISGLHAAKRITRSSRTNVGAARPMSSARTTE